MENWKVYIIHFDEPYKHMRHYIGITKNIHRRMQVHASGNGARLLRVIVNAGIGFKVNTIAEYKTRREALQKERSLKMKRHSSRFCPICRNELLRGNDETVA